MDGKELLQVMLRLYGIILVGAVLSIAIFCSIFYPEASFGVDVFWKLLLLAFLTDLPIVVFYSKRWFPSRKEIGTGGLIVRQIVHFLLVIGVMLTLGYQWEWFVLSSPAEPVVFLLLVSAVYWIARLAVFQRNKKIAGQLNERLKTYRNQKE